MDLFGEALAPRPGDGLVKDAPLAERLRPRMLEELIGQEHLTGPEGAIGRMVRQGALLSVILWGPPGCGKTTLARLLAGNSDYYFEPFSAVMSGTAEMRKVFEAARQRRAREQRTLLFVDEIHRFNRAQQDVLLPYVEDGTVVLVGATTENPSFELNAALLSRTRVLVLRRLMPEDLERMLLRAEQVVGKPLPLTPEARELICLYADGDGRTLLNLCEDIWAAGADATEPFGPEKVSTLLQRRRPVYDKHQESHYNLISALHKSLRGSDPDAALYWCARMLSGGEDPLYLLRRLVRFASEDIGMADPQALSVAIAAREAYEFLGSPEGDLAVSHLVVYLATAPKSNAVYVAHKAALRDADAHGSLQPPMRILNAPTKMMKELGYSTGYVYDHDTPEAFSGQNYFPDEMQRPRYYSPVERGFERDIRKRLEYWERLREEKERKS